MATLFTKLSILLLIKRIFLPCEYDIFWIIQFLIVANGIFYTCFLFIPIWVCSPRDKIRNPKLPGHCLDLTVLLVSSAAWNTCSDIAMLTVPLWMIWKPQLSQRRKIGATIVFATAGLYVLDPFRSIFSQSKQSSNEALSTVSAWQASSAYHIWSCL